MEMGNRLGQGPCRPREGTRVDWPRESEIKPYARKSKVKRHARRFGEAHPSQSRYGLVNLSDSRADDVIVDRPCDLPDIRRALLRSHERDSLNDGSLESRQRLSVILLDMQKVTDRDPLKVRHR